MYTYPRPLDLPYPARVLSNEGPLSRGDPSADRAKAGRTGRPGTVDGLVAGGALGGAAPCLGRARCLAARGGSVNPASRVPVGALAPPTAPSLARFARNWQTSDALRRENAEARLFESSNQNSKRGALLTSPRSFAGRGRREAPGEGPGTELPDQKTIGSEGLRLNKHDPRVYGLHLPQCLAPHPKPSLRYGFDLSPQERGEVKKLRCAAFGAREEQHITHTAMRRLPTSALLGVRSG
jgi:hypothetical protein